MTKPGHSEAEDDMARAFMWVVAIVIAVIGLLGWGAYELVLHLLKVTNG